LMNRWPVPPGQQAYQPATALLGVGSA